MVRSYAGDRERINFYLDREILDGLKKLAALTNTTYSELIRQACREYVAGHTSQAHSDKANLKEFISHE